MSWVILAEFPLEKNLKGVNNLLIQHDIVHRFTEEGGKQRLWIAEAERAKEIYELIVNYLDGQMPEGGDSASRASYESSTGGQTSPNVFVAQLLGSPITATAIALSIVGYLLVFLKLESILYWLVFLNFDHIFETLEFWRFVSPAIIHFGVLHVLFNCLWAFVLGVRLEPFLGKLHFTALLLVTALAGNLMQAPFMHVEATFGGLSGVVYGLFGCMFFLHRKWPIRDLSLPIGIYVFMILNLVLGFAGVLDLFIMGSVANWAHLGGLIAGMAFGWLFSLKNDYKA